MNQQEKLIGADTKFYICPNGTDRMLEVELVDDGRWGTFRVKATGSNSDGALPIAADTPKPKE